MSSGGACATARAAGILATQVRWKASLEARLARIGTRRAMTELERLGVRSCGQVRAWTDPRLKSIGHMAVPFGSPAEAMRLGRRWLSHVEALLKD